MPCDCDTDPARGGEGFARPTKVDQPRYEALRAYLHEGVPLAEAAQRFGYTPRVKEAVWKSALAIVATVAVVVGAVGERGRVVGLRLSPGLTTRRA